MVSRRAFLVATAPLATVARNVPPLREWQAKRVAYGYAVQQRRPGYRVVKTRRVSPSRVAVHGEEPGYLGEAPDVTVTLVERRRFQFWVRDPFTGRWVRWL